VAAFTSEHQRDLASDPTPGAGDQRDACCGPRQGLSAQKRKNIGRLVDWLSRLGSVRQRTLGLCVVLCDDEPPPPETVSHAVSATSKTSTTTERRAHFMRPF
jgi:hypothetical protein